MIYCWGLVACTYRLIFCPFQFWQILLQGFIFPCSECLISISVLICKPINDHQHIWPVLEKEWRWDLSVISMHNPTSTKLSSVPRHTPKNTFLRLEIFSTNKNWMYFDHIDLLPSGWKVQTQTRVLSLKQSMTKLVVWRIPLEMGNGQLEKGQPIDYFVGILLFHSCLTVILPCLHTWSINLIQQLLKTTLIRLFVYIVYIVYI